MSDLGDLLATVEARASEGHTLAVVRVLSPASSGNLTVTVTDEEVSPPIEDSTLSDVVVSSVQRLIDSGRATDLLDVVDGKGSPVRLAIELVKAKLELIIFGAGHVGQATARIAAIMGYDVVVVDDREEFASRSRFPDPKIQVLACDFAGIANKLRISAGTAVVIVTRGHQYDELCLKNVIRSSASYIGMIGSRKRVMSVFKKLESEGISGQDLKRVHAPIGLRIGARSPQEIAVSILAEIVDHVNNPTHKQKGEENGI
jgi:xanthine/CO dehydrogenase XdhC/CoxF family maturation factor